MLLQRKSSPLRVHLDYRPLHHRKPHPLYSCSTKRPRAAWQLWQPVREPHARQAEGPPSPPREAQLGPAARAALGLGREAVSGAFWAGHVDDVGEGRCNADGVRIDARDGVQARRFGRRACAM